jgi:hypothetical protein
MEAQVIVCSDGDGVWRVLVRKGDPRFSWSAWAWDRQRVLRDVGRSAADPELDFNWEDAAHISFAIRNSWPVCDAPHGLLSCTQAEKPGVISKWLEYIGKAAQAVARRTR